MKPLKERLYIISGDIKLSCPTKRKNAEFVILCQTVLLGNSNISNFFFHEGTETFWLII